MLCVVDRNGVLGWDGVAKCLWIVTARELKTVQINRPTPYLRLLFAKCHLNPYNFFNQVGIVGLDAFGDVVTPLRLVTPIRASPAPEVDLKALRPPSSTVRMGKPGAGGFDVVTAQKIKELEALKVCWV